MDTKETRPVTSEAGNDQTAPICTRAYVVCDGERLERAEGHWRDQIDLTKADVPTAYGAGLADGYELAVRELRQWAVLLVDELERQAVAR